MMTDPIADMLTRIRNAGMAQLEKTSMPRSNVKSGIADILKAEGYVADCSTQNTSDVQPTLELVLRYGADRRSAIKGIRRVSRPGRRMYVPKTEIPRVYNGMGIAILSTSKGLMTDRDARKHGVGGEVLCEVW